MRAVRCRSAVPIVRDIFDRLSAKRIPAASVAAKAGLNEVTVSGWRSGRKAPNMANFNAFIQAAGFDLAIVEKRDAA